MDIVLSIKYVNLTSLTIFIWQLTLHMGDAEGNDAAL